MMYPTNSARHKQHGIVMVEATIVLPLLMLMLLVIAEFGRTTMLLTTLNKAQQDGARFLSFNAFAEGDTQTVQLSAQNMARARNLIVHGDINGAGTALLDGLSAEDIQISESPAGSIQITTTYAYTPLLGDVFDVSFPLRSSVNVRAVK